MSLADVEDLSKVLQDLQLATMGDESPVDVDNVTSTLTKIEDDGDTTRDLKQRFLNPSNVLPWDLLDLVQDVPQRDLKDTYDSLVTLPQSISRSQYRFKRRGIEGKVVRYAEEVNFSDVANSNAATSISVNRAYGENSLRGTTSQLPFKPGGLQLAGSKDTTAQLHRDADGLFDVAQGLTRGLQIESIKEVDDLDELEDDQDENEREEQRIIQTLEDDAVPLDKVASSENSAPQLSFEKEIDELLPVDVNFGRAIVPQGNDLLKPKKEWAHVVDLNHKIDNFDELIPNMARKWPFTLDTFQQEAVYHLEQGDSVFVAAHTSAGKTVIAEYAIAMANRNMTKAIYTSPIKALSNQKFRDFKEDFKEVDVGLITGDVQINPEANCLIMTTEILRSMLYRGADLIRDVEFIIFDEVHYVNDIDRGVVWEEVIIMLPDHVKFILLSATVPNTYEFANWVGRTKHKDIYVISTPKRPVPLEINLWGKNKLTKAIDAERNFLDANYSAYQELYEGKKPPPAGNQAGGRGGRGGRGGAARGGGRGNQVAQRGGRGGFGGRGGGGAGQQNRFQTPKPNKNTWVELVHFLNGNNLLPAVIFVFSKKRCEEYAQTLQSVDFCNAREKSQIHMFIDKAVARLKKEDRELPQILVVRDMLSRGVAVHHGGLLPIVKETIEILFAKGLIKVLFATETFAMGLNLPTRTVVFSELRKHDGTGFRNLTPGEFTQMSGRAGRRGLDKIGTVIVMSYSEPLNKLTLKDVCLGTPTKLVSQFRLTYNMILNLLRIEALRVEEMIKHSFSENTSQTMMPEHQKKINELEDKLNNLPALEITDPFTEAELEDVFQKLIIYKETVKQMMEESMSSPVLAKKFHTGRLIVFKDAKGHSRAGFIIRQNTYASVPSFSVLCFNMGSLEREEPTGIPYLGQASKFMQTNFTKMKFSGDFHTREVPLTSIELVCRAGAKVRINEVLRNNKEEISQLEENLKILLRFQHKFQEVDWNEFATLKLHEMVKNRDELVSDITKSPCIESPNFKKYFMLMNKKYEITQQIKSLNMLLSDENLELLPDYEQRLQVLKELEFVDKNLNVMLKGRVACEINSGWELVITELVLDNFLGDFEPEEIVALLSAFVYEGRTSQDEEAKITPRMERGKQKILEITSNIIDVFVKYQVTMTSEEQDFLERKRFALVNVVYEWARGMTFKEIMELSVEAEGTIVRVITRLDEVCREVKSAAMIIGDSALHAKMTEAQEKIKRDIVFAASLYL